MRFRSTIYEIQHTKNRVSGEDLETHRPRLRQTLPALDALIQERGRGIAGEIANGIKGSNEFLETVLVMRKSSKGEHKTCLAGRHGRLERVPRQARRLFVFDAALSPRRELRTRGRPISRPHSLSLPRIL